MNAVAQCLLWVFLRVDRTRSLLKCDHQACVLNVVVEITPDNIRQDPFHLKVLLCSSPTRILAQWFWDAGGMIVLFMER